MELLVHFIAAVVVSQRRAVLDVSCHDCDDALKHFHGLSRVDVVDCMAQARRFHSRMMAR
jgi:hypothetical protein